MNTKDRKRFEEISSELLKFVRQIEKAPTAGITAMISKTELLEALRALHATLATIDDEGAAYDLALIVLQKALR